MLDLDATDDPLHGQQEGRFFHCYYKCYCYLPLYIFCGRHLLAARLRRSNIDAGKGAVEEVERIVWRIRQTWPRVRIILRGDSGFAREELMAWCEANRIDYVYGLARNERLEARIAPALQEACLASRRSGQAARVFRDFMWSTRESWSRRKRAIAKAEWTTLGPNLRFIVTSLRPKRWADLVHPRKSGAAVLVAQERTSRYTLLAKQPSKHAHLVSSQLQHWFNPLPAKLRRSLTQDNGPEFFLHHQLNPIGIKTYFCNPYSPWQKSLPPRRRGAASRT